MTEPVSEPPHPAEDRHVPQSLEAERAVLGAILIDGDVLAAGLEADDFYRPEHRDIYAAMLRLSERRVPPDVVMVFEEMGDGDAGYLAGLANECPTCIFLPFYAAIVARKARMRRLIQAAGRIASIGYEDGPDADEAVARARAELEGI